MFVNGSRGNVSLWRRHTTHGPVNCTHSGTVSAPIPSTHKRGQKTGKERKIGKTRRGGVRVVHNIFASETLSVRRNVSGKRRRKWRARARRDQGRIYRAGRGGTTAKRTVGRTIYIYYTNAAGHRKTHVMTTGPLRDGRTIRAGGRRSVSVHRAFSVTSTRPPSPAPARVPVASSHFTDVRA